MATTARRSDASNRHQQHHLHLHSTPPLQVREVMCSQHTKEDSTSVKLQKDICSTENGICICNYRLFPSLKSCGADVEQREFEWHFFCSRLLFHLVESLKQLFSIQERKFTVAVTVGALW
ncbi:hypothetical protein CDAR_52021 [Caerostris darwini]|uniref:Uncharacterized protein n=1 Tax=Caerostris darwini TaxID=1538125 RepID=A0AAV4RA69_9ARAC|nr:hypothetical protein CDAR_52021 [Caerostris darwini]